MSKTGTTSVVALDQIEVDDALNPRGEIEIKSLGELIASIEQVGILQPVLVEPADGHYRLVAGYRRARAAAAIELGEIPVLIREAGESRTRFALSENLPGLREQMDPVSEARAIERIANAESLSQKRLAGRLGKSESFVRERLRLLRLPAASQGAIASGGVPIAAAPELERIAKASERLADEVAIGLANETIELSELVEDAGLAVAQVLDALDPERDAPAIHLGHANRVQLDRQLAPSQEVEELIERVAAIRADEGAYGEGLGVRLEERHVDALRALGVLLEYEPAEDSWRSAYRFCTDPVALVDQLGLAVEAEAKRRATELREAEKAAREAAGAKGVDTSELDSQELAKASRKAERAERAAQQALARLNNEELGHRLVKRRGRKVSAKRQSERARAIARLVVAKTPALGAALRLVREDWKVSEIPNRKDGAPGKEKLTHLDPAEAEARLLAEIEKAADCAGVVELLVEALVAASYASEAELVKSQRSNDVHLGVRDSELERLIDSEAKGVLPEGLVGIAKRRTEDRSL